MAILSQLSDVLTFFKSHLLQVLFVLVVLRVLRNRYRPGVRNVPGPFLASISDLWNFLHCCRRKTTEEWQLHEKYSSPLVRLAPNLVSCADPEGVRVIYGLKRIFPKSEHYMVQDSFNDGQRVQNLSAQLDESKHSKLKRAVGNAYALSTLLDFEPLVDSTSKTFMSAITARFAHTGVECPLSDWLQMYAFDIIGELTFSKQFGFIKEGKDVGLMMHHTGVAMDYIGMIGQMPWWDYYLRLKNPILPLLRRSGDVVAFTVRQIREHVAHPDGKRKDFLTRFIQAGEKYAELVTEPQLAELANTNVAAGSDTTAIALRSIVYRLLTNPTVYARFMGELKAVIKARKDDEDFDRPITFNEGNSMTYLKAIIKESLRLHPALGQILPRKVPEGGVVLCGTWLPADTVVGCNAWTTHRDKKLYHPDPHTFRPERWLDSTEEQIRSMEALNFAFGAGTRVCIGRNIANLEIEKFVPEFFRRFELELVDLRRWNVLAGWVVPQRGLDVKIKARDPATLLT